VQRPDTNDDRGLRLNILDTLASEWRRVVRTGAVLAGVAAVGGLVYLLWGQPVRYTASLEFQPTFTGAAQGRYPNGQVFATTDITAQPVADLVYDRNALGDYCDRQAFRSGFFVELRSMAIALLDAEYLGRLSDVRLTAVERDRLQAEYEAKRSALPVQYRLVFSKGDACAAIPDQVTSKVLADMLSVWAEESEARRGVLNLQVPQITERAFDLVATEATPRLVRADLLRAALMRVRRSLLALERTPGAELVHIGDSRLTVSQLLASVEDLISARLDPLIVNAGRALGRNSRVWVEQMLVTARQEQRLAEGRAEAFLSALREYSGQPRPADRPGEASGAMRGQAASDVQSITPQIDRTFIDRIVELSADNTAFRQEMTRNMVQANVSAVDSRAKADYYAELARSLSVASDMSLTAEEFDQQLKGVADTGRGVVANLLLLEAEIARVSLRPAGAIFQASTPPVLVSLRSFTVGAYGLLVFGVFAAGALMALGYCLVRRRVGQAR
jgi:hypothetical protein